VLKVDKEKFLSLYTNEYGALTDSRRDGISFLLDCLMDDDQVQDIRWAAYMLATVKHECAGTWQPIAEYGKGKGLKYGTPDPVTKHVYYGRGYVQLTWPGNYKAMSKPCGVDLYQDPDKAMEPGIAYRIMSYGMRNGTFTGASLKSKINAEKCDYVNARRIINGTDVAEKIAGYAVKIQQMIISSTMTTT